MGLSPISKPTSLHFSNRIIPSTKFFSARGRKTIAGLEMARRVAARYPSIPARFFTTGEPEYINAKVRSMELMEAAAAHDILVISDSDVRVTPDYLRAVALPFADAQVGAADLSLSRRGG